MYNLPPLPLADTIYNQNNGKPTEELKITHTALVSEQCLVTLDNYKNQ